MKVWITVGVILVIVGIALFLWAMFSSSWDFSRLETSKCITNTHVIDESFTVISVDTVTADVVLLPSEGDECRVECYEYEKAKHSVSADRGTLRIELEDNRAWYEHIGLHIDKPKITVHLPERDYSSLSVEGTTGDVDVGALRFGSIDVEVTTGDISIYASAQGEVDAETTTGDITLKDMSASDIEVSNTTGDITLDGVRCRDLETEGRTGDLIMKDVIASGSLTDNRTTGDVKLDGCDAGEINISVTTGSITGTLLTTKVFSAESNTGRVTVPKNTEGGKCELSATTGDIEIKIK